MFFRIAIVHPSGQNYPRGNRSEFSCWCEGEL